MDMAVGIIIGAAFGKIVSSFVADVVMPPIGYILGGIDLSHLHIVLKDATETAAAITWNYGAFFNTIVDFVIIAFAVFMMVKQMNKLQKKEEAKPTAPPEDVLLLREIRDALKK